MNPFRDPLEEELAALRPREPSPDLEQAIAERLSPAVVDGAASRPPLLSNKKRGEKKSWRWVLGLAAGAVAGGIAVAVLLPRGGDRPPAGEPLDKAPQPLVTSAFDAALPAVWQYHSALVRSPSEIDALLDEHAGPGRVVGSPAEPIHSFTRFDPGEL